MPYRIERGQRLNCAGTPKDNLHSDFTEEPHFYHGERGPQRHVESRDLNLLDSQPSARYWRPLFAFAISLLFAAMIALIIWFGS